MRVIAFTARAEVDAVYAPDGSYQGVRDLYGSRTDAVMIQIIGVPHNAVRAAMDALDTYSGSDPRVYGEIFSRLALALKGDRA